MFHPKKQLGQHFLKNPEIVSKIVQAAEIDENDTIIEVGPGTGILTDELIKNAKIVFAIEKDYDLITKLQKLYKNTKNLKIVHQDILWFDLSTFDQYKVVANIPYQITSPLIRKFIEAENKPVLMVLMVQKEVAERITAKPGSSERGLLTLIVEFYADAKILFEVSKKEFYPVPQVDSAVIELKPKVHLRGGRNEVKPDKFFKIVKAGFAAKRRQVHNSLAATLRMPTNEILAILKQAKITPTLRAEDLTLTQWLDLYQILDKKL